MTYPFIPIGLLAVFIITLAYLLIKKDMRKFSMVLYPGLFFATIWMVIYHFMFY